MICILGDSFAPEMFRKAARYHGIPQTSDPSQADVVFVSQDTPTDEQGRRDLVYISELVRSVRTDGTIVLTSQVPPGFTRSLGIPIYHQSETLRIVDAFTRAIYPEQFIVGCANPENSLPPAYSEYLAAFGHAYSCPVHKMTYEEAEFSKIAINLTLASQVENTNRLADYARRHNINWETVCKALKSDKRIGPYSYLKPGNWQESKHLLRDWMTFESG